MMKMYCLGGSQFRNYLNNTIYYKGTIQENKDKCIIAITNSDGKTIREVPIDKEKIKKIKND